MPFGSTISCNSQRWIVCALCSLVFAILSIRNTCFYGFANIVNSALVKKKKPSGGCPFLFSGSSWDKPGLLLDLPEFYWNSRVMDVANSAFFTGRMIMVLPAGMLSDLGYSKYVLCGGMLLDAVDHLFLLTFAKLGVTVFVVQNFFEGISEALIYPSIFTLISHWALPSERNLFTALVVAGIFYGDTLGHLFFHLIYLRFRSWEVGQFITGTLGLLWLVLGFIFIYHSPNKSPFIQRNDFPITNTGHRRRSIPFRLKRLQGIPWRKICSSRPFLSLILAYCSVDWAAYLNIWGSFEEYHKYILRLPERFSDESSIIVIAVVPTSLMGGLLADWVNKHNLISNTTIKKSFIFIGVFFSSLLQVTTVWVGCNIMLFWVLSITAAYILGLANSVIYSTPIDLCSRHAGLLMAILTGAKTICFIFKAKIKEILITDNYIQDQWRNKFISCSSLALILIIPFLLFGSGEAQQWSNPSPVIPFPDSIVTLDPALELEKPKEPTPPPTPPLNQDQNSSPFLNQIWNRLSK